ncbi:MAG TPA: hypothetical protein VMP00_05820 [Burkholderiales bacterium]|nr:hypothetical protein [Burkholderiales bacterium]
MLLAATITSHTAVGAVALRHDLDFIGDARVGYYGAQRDDRDGSEDSTDQFVARLRAGAEWQPTDTVSARLRVAGRYSTHENRNHFTVFTTIPDTDGLRAGDSTIDQLYLSFTPSDKWAVEIGRLQTSFELAGVSAGTLDRNDSPNADITWTDGVHAHYRSADGWNWHLIMQRNLQAGATNVRLPPLSFRNDSSRVSYFVAVENREPYGPVVQRAFDVSYLPNSLEKGGTPLGHVEDYIAMVVRLSAQWPIGNVGTRLLAGAEIGYAPNTPTKLAVGTGTTGTAGGLAWQAQLSFLDVRPGHSFALQHGRAEAGWLISPDFRNNEILYEIRHEWALADNQTRTTRLRRRDEMDRLVGATRERRDEDVFVRYTYEF